MIIKKIVKWFRRPSDPSGNVYYARLLTNQGIFYKLGYTKKSTLHERMAYGGTDDERLIDQVLLFSFQPDAWDIEQTLLENFDKLKAFGKYSNDKAFPLAGRGQSELFREDILGIDDTLYQEIAASPNQNSSPTLDEKGGGCLLTALGIILIPFTFGLSLFFIFGGLSSVFNQDSNHLSLNNKIEAKRPKHPPKIQALLDRLRMPPSS